MVVLLLEVGAEKEPVNIPDPTLQPQYYSFLIIFKLICCSLLLWLGYVDWCWQDHKNDQGSTALMNASLMGHKEVARLLLGAGASVDQSDEKGFTPLILAATAGHDKVRSFITIIFTLHTHNDHFPRWWRF